MLRQQIFHILVRLHYTLQQRQVTSMSLPILLLPVYIVTQRVLDSLLNFSKQILQENILLHPLVETFHFFKWKKLHLFFFLIMALYMIFTLSLNNMALFIYVLKTDVEVFRHSTTVSRIVFLTSLALIIVQVSLFY